MTDAAPRVRFLVLHDYGMGGLWWWVWARSAREVTERLAEVEVVDDPEAVERAGAWDLEETDIDAPVLPSAVAPGSARWPTGPSSTCAWTGSTGTTTGRST